MKNNQKFVVLYSSESLESFIIVRIFMIEEEIGFDDWQKQAELITIDNLLKSQQPARTQQQKPIEIVTSNSQQVIDPYQKHLKEIERIKKLTTQQFQQQFKAKQEIVRKIQPVNVHPKAEEQFNNLAKNVGEHLKNVAKDLPEKCLGESQILTFFEEFLLYLYPNIEWETVEAVKEKIKILKKDKKQEELKIKKLRQKEQRLKRAYGKQQASQNAKKQENIAGQQKMEEESM